MGSALGRAPILGAPLFGTPFFGPVQVARGGRQLRSNLERALIGGDCLIEPAGGLVGLTQQIFADRVSGAHCDRTPVVGNRFQRSSTVLVEAAEVVEVARVPGLDFDGALEVELGLIETTCIEVRHREVVVGHATAGRDLNPASEESRRVAPVLKLLAGETEVESITQSGSTVTITLLEAVGGARLALEKALGPLARVGNQQVRINLKEAGDRWQDTLVTILERLKAFREQLPAVAAVG